MEMYLLDYDASVPLVEEEWDKNMPMRSCKLNPEHPPVLLGEGESLRVILPKPTTPDFLWTGESDCLITDDVARMLCASSLSGYDLRPAKVTKIKQQKDKLVDLPVLWELKVIGWGGIASPASGIRVLEPRCPDCGYSRWGALIDQNHLLDEALWDGSDFFIIWPLPGFIFVNEHVRKFVIEHEFSNVSITPLALIDFHEEFEAALGFGFAPGRLSHYFPADRAKKIGGPLGID